MPRFTAETAAEMARRSHSPTSRRNLLPMPPADLPQPAPEPADCYANSVLSRTRKQLDLTAERILEELAKPRLDSRRLRDLSDAQRHLAEQERILAGRPLPGSMRPTRGRDQARISPLTTAMPRPVAPLLHAAGTNAAKPIEPGTCSTSTAVSQTIAAKESLTQPAPVPTPPPLPPGSTAAR